MELVKFRIKAKSGELLGHEWLEEDGTWREASVDGQNFITVGKFLTEQDGRWGLSNKIVRQQFSGFYERKSREQIELYVGDIVEAQDAKNSAPLYMGEIIWDKGCMSLRIMKGSNMGFNVGQSPPLFEFFNLKLVK